ncbi:MAG: hypothetical protein KQH59_09940, partial [Desulfobulbaceae bacterium]|nr:hypothetical protein [Desulfobulbaceae bacterium]
MTTTVEENAAETIDCQVEHLASLVKDLQDQIDAEAGGISRLKQQLVSCQEAIERHKQVVADCDKRLDETACKSACNNDPLRAGISVEN